MAIDYSPTPVPAPAPAPTPPVETYRPAPVPVPVPTPTRPVNYGPTPQPAPAPEPNYPEAYSPAAPLPPVTFLTANPPPYAVAILDEGDLITPKVTQIDFIGAIVTATADGSIVSVQVNPEDIATVSAGTSIEVTPTATSNGTNYQITNTFTENVVSLGTLSGNVTPNRATATIQKMVLTGNITLFPPSNMAAGQSLTLILTQDGVGNRILSPSSGSNLRFAMGWGTLSTDPNVTDMLNMFSDGTYTYITLTNGYV